MFNLEEHLENIQEIHSHQNRKWDKDVPYWIHPLWCATMILSEPLLTEEQRHTGALALLYHDSLEAGGGVPPKVFRLVQDMTFDGFDAEMQLLMSKPDFVILLKLYDKVSNLLDGHWMTKQRYDEYRLHTLRILSHVKEVYGNLQICEIAKAVVYG